MGTKECPRCMLRKTQGIRLLPLPLPSPTPFLCVFFQALGKLIRTIGSTLDTDKNTLYMKELFRLMDKIANNKNINSRMRFMIRDLEELRVRACVRARVAVFFFT